MDLNDVWPLPKSASFVQFVGMVEELINQQMSGKTWNHAKQEALATAMRNRNLTVGRNMSGQRVRTLFANGPKFLGFAFTDEASGRATSPKIVVTEAGHALAREELLKGHSGSSLSDWERSVGRLNSDVISLQLMKLCLNNPVTNSSGRFLISPFRLVMRLCIDLGWLDQEELAYFVFSFGDENEYDLLVQRIRNFRSLDDEARDLEIAAYKKTDAGRLTLVKAPTSNYFLSFCEGIPGFVVEREDFGRGRTRRIVRVADSEHAAAELSRFGNSIPYDFGDQLSLWIEYFGNPEKLEPPFDVRLSINLGDLAECYLEISRNGGRPELFNHSVVDPDFSIPAFQGDLIEINAFSIEGDKLGSFRFESLERSSSRLELDLRTTLEETRNLHQEPFRECLFEISSSGWDSAFLNKLKLVEKITGSNFKDNRTKGGRLEEVTFGYLSERVEAGDFDRAEWFGRKEKGKYGLPSPAPGGRNGNPDIVVEIDDYSLVLELTTIRGNAGQWASSEAASVPDHVINFARQNIDRKVCGFFIAPTINNRVQSNFEAQSHINGVPIVCLSIQEFVDFFDKERSDITNELENIVNSK